MVSPAALISLAITIVLESCKSQSVSVLRWKRDRGSWRELVPNLSHLCISFWHLAWWHCTQLSGPNNIGLTDTRSNLLECLTSIATISPERREYSRCTGSAASGEGHGDPKSRTSLDFHLIAWSCHIRTAHEGRRSLQSWDHPKDNPSVMEGGDVASEVQAVAAEHEVRIRITKLNEPPA